MMDILVAHDVDHQRQAQYRTARPCRTELQPDGHSGHDGAQGQRDHAMRTAGYMKESMISPIIGSSQRIRSTPFYLMISTEEAACWST